MISKSAEPTELPGSLKGTSNAAIGHGHEVGVVSLLYFDTNYTIPIGLAEIGKRATELVV